MADNFDTNAASTSGQRFASDDLGGSPSVHIPRVKPSWGVDGTATDASVSAPLPTQGTIESTQMSNLGTIVTPKYAVIAASSSGNNTVIAAAGASKKIRVLAAVFMSNGTVNAKFQSGASGTDLTGLFYMLATTGASLPFNPAGWFETAANTLLNLNLSAAVAVGGCITYVEII